uniref:Uncharacterized protein n=1 Tax=Picea sitchensis TaxID=3332 RepID=D5A8Z9_PICSI|nr:unknown [Picea sitchensis]
MPFCWMQATGMRPVLRQVEFWTEQLKLKTYNTETS